MMRRFLALLSAGGFTVSIFAYIRSLFGTTSDHLRPSVAALVVGALMLQVPIPLLERSSVKDRTFWRAFAQGMPRWAYVCINLLWLIAIAHLVWFFVRSDAAAPIIKDGQYVLSSRGRIRRELTEPKYLILKAGELRLYAAFMMACYITPMLYWWFPRKRAAVVPCPPLSS